jgi:mRNA deadenylase 3'-5' endonuclease subunit Ccr4
MLSVVSFNVLADAFINPGNISYCPRTCTTFKYRSALILQKLSSVESDIICLQEVDHFKEFFLPKLEELGYVGFQQSRPGQNEDSIAVFVKKSKFKVLRTVSVDYNQLSTSVHSLPNTSYYQRDNVGLILILESISDNQRKIILANTHLFWNPKNPDIKIIQASCLAHAVEQQVAKYPGARVVVCGDWNSTPSGGVYEFWKTGSLDIKHAELKSTKLSSPLRHSLKLESAYLSAMGREPVSFFTSYFQGTLDYIWFSKSNMTVSKVLTTLNDFELKEYTALPSPMWPSDHVLLGCILKFI